ncbi:MAG: shikimate dehydrogenase family protein, partial [Armatimonadota bacterium]
YNTDGIGFIRSLRDAGWSASDSVVTMIGAGGAAAAVALAVARDEKPARLVILNRTPEKADQVANMVRNNVADLTVITGDLTSRHSQDLIGASEVLIDCTSVGMYPDVDVDPVVPGELLNEDMIVCDLTYNPRETVLLKAAKTVGANTLEGTGMLLYQGASAYELWTGRDAPVEVMRQALLDALKQRAQPTE